MAGSCTFSGNARWYEFESFIRTQTPKIVCQQISRECLSSTKYMLKKKRQTKQMPCLNWTKAFKGCNLIHKRGYYK